MTEQTQMGRLERRYRAVLLWYPAAWRARNADPVLGTLLELAEHDSRLRPRRGELANLAAHGLLERLRGVPAAVPSDVRDRVATGALGIGAAMALSGLVQLESEPARQAYLSSIWGDEVATFGLFLSPLVLVYPLWLAAFLAAIAGFTGVARWLAGVTIPLTIAGRVLSDASGMWLRPTWMFLGLLVLFAALVLLGRPLADRGQTKASLLWFLPALVLCFSPQVVSPGRVALQNPLWLDQAGVIGWMPLILLGSAALVFVARKRDWAIAAVVLALPFMALAFGGSAGVRPAAAASAVIAGIAIATAAVIWIIHRQVTAVRAPRHHETSTSIR